MEVVAITPLIVEVITPELAERVFELTRDEVEVTPFTTLVRVFTAEVSAFWFMKLAVVVETTPLTVEVRVKLLVEVETVRRLVVPEFMIDCRSVLVATPLMVVVRRVPEAERELEVITEVVPIDPPTFEDITFPEFERAFEVFKRKFKR